MRAMLFDEFGVTPQIVDVPDPSCPPTGAVVRVKATGVCRSDWHAWRGHDATVHTPHVPGHEFAGTIERVGLQVTNFHPGDRVTAPFVYACGRCAQCHAGDHQVCTGQEQPGFTLWGSFAEFVVVLEADLNLVALPDTMGYTEAAALGCRFATAYRAIISRAAVAADEWVAVHGCGGVGLSAIVVAQAAGARVVAVDVSPAALAAAERLGASTVRAGEQAAEEIRRITGGGAHVSVDAFGSAATCLASIASLRPRGRHVQVGLLLGDDAMPVLPMERITTQELDILGSHGMAAHEYPAMLAAIADGRLSPALTLGRIIGFEELGEALSEMSAPASSAGMTVAVWD
jgi:D-arabinose 1-dehydrogenase-like Zn-dependent alcohol dehydrogenase